MSIVASDARQRWLVFAGWTVLSLLLFAKPLLQLAQVAWHDETTSHILLIPFISAWLLYSDPKGNVLEAGYAIRPAMGFVISAIVLASGTVWARAARR